MSNLAVRIATAAVVVPVVVAGLLYLPAVATLAAACVVAFVGAYEILGLFAHPPRSAMRTAGAALGAGGVVLVYQLGHRPGLLIMVVIVLMVVAMLLGLLGRDEPGVSGRRLTGLVLASLYPGLMISLWALLRRDADMGAQWVILALGTAFLSDTGAYFAGRFLGRHKLSPRISPSKTVEGSLGGVLASLLWCVAASYTYLDGLPVLDAAILGVLSSIVGQAGDLVASLLKRSAGAKDMGSFFPGHGGVMDRLDAAVFVAPLVYGYVFLWGGPG